MSDYMPPNIKIHVLSGGVMPERKSSGAIGYDVAIRAVVSQTEMDNQNLHLRKCLFDFKTIPDNPEVVGHVQNLGTELIYRMNPGESVLVGIGFVTVMPLDMFYWMAPRSGLSGKWGITVANAPGTVDPDYRGETGVLVYNRNDHYFDLRLGMRIAQIIFQKAEFPKFESVEDYKGLTQTDRGAGGFGSTGLT